MRAPTWLRLKRKPVQPDPGVVTFTISLDLSGFQRAMADAARSMAKLQEAVSIRRAELAPAFIRLAHLAVEAQRQEAQRRVDAREVLVSGLEARYYVRAGILGDSLGVCRDIRQAQTQMALTGPEVIRLQVAAMAGEAGAVGW